MLGGGVGRESGRKERRKRVLPRFAQLSSLWSWPLHKQDLDGSLLLNVWCMQDVYCGVDRWG